MGTARREVNLNGSRWTFAGLAMPAFLVVVGLQFYPFIYSLWLSFQDWTLTSSADPQGFVGLENYGDALTDATLRQAVRTSLIITGTSVVISTVLGTGLAFLTRGSAWPTRATRTALIVPMVVAPIAAGTLWRIILNSRSGLANTLLGYLGIAGPEWLATTSWARVSVIMLDVWIGTPFILLIVSAALTSISRDLVESAETEGASRWFIMRTIELPLIAPVLTLAVMFRALESLLSLDSIFSLTFGGPGFGTFTTTFLIYTTGLRQFRLGSAAAMSWIFMAVVAVLLLLTFKLQRRWSQT